MKTERLSIEEVHFDPVNARKHDEKNLAAIKASLQRFGQQKPIVIDSNRIVRAGNGTLAAAKALGWDSIDVVRSDLDPSELTAYAIADNRTAELAEWDDTVLKAQLESLDEELRSIAYEDYALPEEKPEPSEEDDKVPEVEENEFKVELGQIWQLGRHRLMCGDSTDKAQVDRLMAGALADMVFTDPPYGMNLDTDFRKMGGEDSEFGKSKKLKNSKGYRRVRGDDSPYDPGHILRYYKGVPMFLWGADYYAERLPKRCDGSWVVWDKRENEDGLNLDGMFGSCFELCWSSEKHRREIARVKWSGFFGTEKEHDRKRVHPTQKPSALVEWFFERWGKDKNIIVDLFLGSGSTLIACEKTNRTCFSCEIDPHYCSVVIKRYMEFTGRRDVYLMGVNGERKHTIDDMQKMRQKV